METDILLENEDLVLQAAGRVRARDLVTKQFETDFAWVFRSMASKADQPEMPLLPAAPTGLPRPTPGMTLEDYSDVVDGAYVDLFRYAQLLHRHVAWLHARVAALESRD